MTAATTATTDDETAATAASADGFDADRAWRLHERVALRPEPFGALAYHYGNRRLTFLRSHDLVALVEALPEAAGARAAFDALGLDARRWPSFEKALRSLVAGEFLVAADAVTANPAQPEHRSAGDHADPGAADAVAADAATSTDPSSADPVAADAAQAAHQISADAHPDPEDRP